MKWLIASDIHGSARDCARLLEAYRREGAERILLLGDILYHGPRNDLPADYNTKAVAAMLNEYRDVIVSVRGNCDAEVDQWVLDFPMMAEELLLEAEGCSIFATHGHKYNEANRPPRLPGGILLHGHTHVPCCREHEDYVCMNPGSVSIPKENSPRGYMTMEHGLFLWKDLDGAEYLRWCRTGTQQQ